jgi:hypothetical protein
MEEKKNYYAIIPADVRYDEEITPNAKLLYAEITALCNEKGFCWSSNDYFAKLYNVSKISISKWISQLEQNGYIETEIIYKEGTKQILNRYIRIVKYPIKEKFNTPIKEKFKDNNTNINNTFNNIKEKINKKEKFVKPTLEELQNYINEKKLNVNAEHFIDYYEANGWKVGKNPMKDWKATIRNWHRRNEEFKKPILPKKEEPLPEWFDKEIEEEKLTKQEQKEIEQILKEFS